MKAKLVLFTTLLAAGAMAHQGTFQILHTYKEGEKDTYKMNMDVTLGSMGDATVSMTLTQTIKKVYDNGDADIESKMADMHVLLGGNEVPNAGADTPPSTQRFNKYGAPVGEE